MSGADIRRERPCSRSSRHSCTDSCRDGRTDEELRTERIDISTIKVRKSVRTFDGEPLSAETLSQLEDFILKDENPFGVPITYRMLDRRRDGVSSPVIVGADTYIAAKYRRQEDAELGFGYSFERLVLYATSLGLGTVWLAATIDRKTFERALEVAPDEVMPAVTPSAMLPRRDL